MTRIAMAVIAAAVAITVGIAFAHSVGHTGGEAKVITGTPRADVLEGTRHRDQIRGLGGNDRIDARDHRQDTIDCGPGKDLVKVDRAEDGVYDCEHVRVPSSAQKGAGR